MRCVIQKVTRAQVDVDGETVGKIGDGFMVLLGAENNEYSGPEIRLFAFNGGKEPVALGLAELKLDGKDYEGFFNMSLPAGKRAVETVSVFIMDFDNIPACKEAVLTLQTEDPETGAPITVFDPVKIPFGA